MYGVVLASMIGLNSAAVECCWNRGAPAGYAGCGGCATCAPVMAMPIGCGCSPCPSCGGSPMMAPPMMGAMGVPIAPAGPPMMGGILVPPIGGSVLPPVQLGETVAPPLNPPAALGETRTSGNQAMFVVRLPADAQLLAEHVPIPGTGPVRVFLSPSLEPGRKYYYDLTIEVNRNGQVLTDSQSVEFEAGKTANVTFGEPTPKSPANPMPPKTTRIRVRMPDGAALYVEGRPWATPVVLTPPLDPNRTHYYQLTIETIRDGRRALVTREVAFRAGQDVVVDFLSDRRTPANVAKSSR
jgi:uncharacterized protein (TIGR03000 family)